MKQSSEFIHLLGLSVTLCWSIQSVTFAETDPFNIYRREAIDLGSRPHLFIDDAGISEMEGVQFVVNPPYVFQTAIDNDKPWDNIAEYTSILDDGSGVYRLYYLNTHRPEGIDNIALATSIDGIHWEKPSLGVVEYEGSTDNNIVIGNLIPHPGGTVLYDPRDPKPEWRYKYLTAASVDDLPDTKTTEGLVIHTSPDGIRFTKQETQIAPFLHDSQAVLLWDNNIEKYVAYLRASDEPLFKNGGRKVVRLETHNIMESWTYRPNPNPHYGGDHELPYLSNELPTALRTDRFDPIGTDLYNNQVHVYERSPNVYLPFPTCYYHYRGERAYLSWSGEGGNEGTGEVQLAVSRDGINFKRYRRPAYIKHGWHANHYTGWPWVYHGMIVRDNRVYQYVSFRTSGHGAIDVVPDAVGETYRGVMRVEQKIDRFVAAEFDYTGGRIVTDPIIFEGDCLVLNIDTGALGEARVALLKADGTPIPGFTTADCDIINADWIKRTVSWRQGDTNLSAWSGQPVRLEFECRGGRIFAFRFAEISTE